VGELGEKAYRVKVRASHECRCSYRWQSRRGGGMGDGSSKVIPLLSMSYIRSHFARHAPGLVQSNVGTGRLPASQI
jgi:hypothetical protein